MRDLTLDEVSLASGGLVPAARPAMALLGGGLSGGVIGAEFGAAGGPAGVLIGAGLGFGIGAVVGVVGYALAD